MTGKVNRARPGRSVREGRLGNVGETTTSPAQWNNYGRQVKHEGATKGLKPSATNGQKPGASRVKSVTGARLAGSISIKSGVDKRREETGAPQAGAGATSAEYGCVARLGACRGATWGPGAGTAVGPNIGTTWADREHSWMSAGVTGEGASAAKAGVTCSGRSDQGCAIMIERDRSSNDRHLDRSQGSVRRSIVA